MRSSLLCLSLICILLSLNAQTIRFNEVVSSNSVYFDEDGDSPDWIELHNYGNQEVSIANWTLTDDVDDYDKWTFPDITLNSNDYLLLWASSKDRSAINYSRTIVNQGDNFKYLVPTNELNSEWKSLSFNDGTWSEGPSGFGYDDGDDATLIPQGSTSLYIRKKFTVDNLSDMASLILDIDYDDGFVAYINGVEIARANINGNPPSYQTTTIQDHEAQMYNGGIPERFSVDDFASILNEGENVIAIQAHNVSSNSSDFTIIPFLSAVFTSPNNSGVTPPAVLNLSSSNYHTNFSISSDSEILSLFDNTGVLVDQLVVENLAPNTSIGVSRSSNDLVRFIETTPGYQNSSNEFVGSVSSHVVFSKKGGLIEGPFNLVLSGNQADEVIRYELGGAKPTKSSPQYTNAISISSNTSIRARIYSENKIPSPIYSESYILSKNHEIDVMLLTVEPDDFFHQDTGIYVFGPEGTFDQNIPFFGANFWEDWERPIHFSFHEQGEDTSVSFNAGVKIFGGWSRGQNGQRSMSLFARGQYGDSKFEHSFFDQLQYDDFEALVIRNSGQDWLRTSMKDITLTSLMRGSGLDFSEHNPVATYINGQYWGMYNLREKINEHMLAAKHNVNADQITILTNNAEVVEGDNEEYVALMNYVRTTDLSINSNFKYVKQRVDLKEYALYKAANIFFNNTDWPGNNIKYWKHSEGKWRWIMYDTDFGFGPWWDLNSSGNNTLSFALEPSGPAWPNPSWSTLLFRRLTRNIGFRNQFINRYADELNTRFLPANVIAHINKIYSSISPEMTAHYERWRTDPSLSYYNISIDDIDAWINFFVNEMRSFAVKRHPVVKDHILSEFNLPSFHPITIINYDLSEGFVNVNDNLNIQEDSWTGDYFETVPIQLKAIARQGYEFSHWSGDLSSTDEIVEISLEDAFEITPNFKPAKSLVNPIVINEINYRSKESFDTDDWIELYNPNDSSIDLSGWTIKDDNDAHIFSIPSGTSIEADGYLVFVKDSARFSIQFPEITNYIGELGFGFGRTDSVRLYNENNLLHDQVGYQSESPWPTCADKTGNTLELITSNLDNLLPESWSCINSYGSPSAINELQTSILNEVTLYPNPVRSILTIDGIRGAFNTKIYSNIGQLVYSSSNVKQIDVRFLSDGVYHLTIEKEGEVTVKNFVKY